MKARPSTAFTSIVFLLRCKFFTCISSLFTFLYQRKGKQVCKSSSSCWRQTSHSSYLCCASVPQHTLGLGVSDWRHTKVCHKGRTLGLVLMSTTSSSSSVRAPGGTSLLPLTCWLSTCKRPVVLADRSRSFPANILPFKVRNMIFTKY